MSTSIEWTDATWNPVTGCSKVSPGCAHCYAETVALRFWPTQYPPIEVELPIGDCTVKGDASVTYRERKFTDVQCHEDRLDQPLRWRKPRKVFVNSMSDLFHEDVPDAFIDRVFAVMALAPQHTFQVLTKRAERMLAYLNDATTPSRIDAVFLSGAFDLRGGRICLVQPNAPGGLEGWPLSNVWLGVSVENQHFADERIPLLLQTPAAVRFISAEPLLERVDLTRVMLPNGGRVHALGGTCTFEGDPPDGSCFKGLDWIIVGGESGAGARMCSQQWIRSVVEQCRASGVPVFVKQIGKMSCFGEPGVNGGFRPKDGKGGDPAEWPADLRVREFPT